MSGPRHMSRMIPEVAGKALGKNGLNYGVLITEWARIVGDDLASRATPVKLAVGRGERRAATLTVAVPSAFAPGLQHALPQVIERINGYFGFQAVAQVKLVHDTPARRPRRPLANVRALTPVEEQQLVGMVDLVGDPGLKSALERLGRAIQGRDRPD